jgi:hypothetical protein
MGRTFMTNRKISFEDACRQYVHRFTMDHVPEWARTPLKVGKYYAPQYRSDREWYDNTVFPGEPGHYGTRNECNTHGQTWPLGQWLTEPFHKANR